MDTDSWFVRFRIPGIVELEHGEGGLPVVRIQAGKAVCRVHVMGAHVTSFLPDGERNMLWMSPYSRYESQVALRGGIPVCFPWFGQHRLKPSLPLHGFVRTRDWTVLSSSLLGDGRTRVVFTLDDDGGTRKVCPCRFHLELTVTVGTSLVLELFMENTGDEPFWCEEGFHSYFSVSHPRNCLVRGLDGVEYVDRVHGDVRGVLSGDLPIVGPMVHACMGVPSTYTLIDRNLSHGVRVTQTGMHDTVVWNPGETLAMENPEIRDSWNRFVCVESANCLDHAFTVPPGGIRRCGMELERIWFPDDAGKKDGGALGGTD